jgi:predicted amidohydrolase YtcJ
MQSKKPISMTMKANIFSRIGAGLAAILLGSCQVSPSGNWSEFVAGENAPAACSKEQPASETIYLAKEFITMDPRHPVADWVFVQCGRISAMGGGDIPKTLHEMNIPLDRRFADQIVLPGFIDPHLHPMIAGVLLPTHFITPEDWDLPRGFEAGVKTPAAYWGKLKTELVNAPADQAFISWGWHELWHGPMTRQMLDAVDDTKPIIIWQRSFHEIVANTKGMELLGVPNEAAFLALIDHPGIDPSHANYEEGYFSETALATAFRRLAPTVMNPAHLQAGFAEMKAMLRQNGVTTISDMATGIFGSFPMEAALIHQNFDGTEVPTRAMLMPYASELSLRARSLEAAPALARADEKSGQTKKVFLNNRVKLLADGAFFAPAMKLENPAYLDGRSGKWITEPELLNAQARTFWDAGFSLHIHVNGDGGLDAVLDAMAKLPRDGTFADQQITLEHLGISREDQIIRIADMVLRVSAQPNYLYVVSGKYAGKLLEQTQASEMVRLGSLEREDVPIALHSDLTMAPADPLFLAWIAVNRINMDGQSMAPDQRISIDTALRAITIEAAGMLGMADQIGSITIGKKADFTVLGENPYEVDPMHLRDIEVKGVVFEGVWFGNGER